MDSAPILFSLPGCRVPEAVARSRLRSLFLPSPASPLDDLEAMLAGALAIVGADAALAPLQLPFSIKGEVDARMLAEALVSEPPQPPPAAIVLAAAASWREDGGWDALDALWCAPGDHWLGMASLQSRMRAMPDPLLRSAGGYMERSLHASLLCDLDEACGLPPPPPCWGQAIVLEPEEMCAAAPGWPADRWAMVALDEHGGRARPETAWGQDAVASALAGRAVWPPRQGLPMWYPAYEEEALFVSRLLQSARRRPPSPRADWGKPGDEVEW